MHWVGMSSRSPLVSDTFSVFPFFFPVNLDALEGHRPAPCRTAPTVASSVALLIIRLELWVFGKKTTEVKYPSQPMTSGLPGMFMPCL